MALKMDLERDFADVLRQRLLAAGFPSRSETDEETIARYLNVLNRKIEPRPRRTRKSATFTCPPDHQAGLDELLRISEAGGDLRPYQSTGVEQDEYDDGMLNAWNLHHFHLGTTPHPRFPTFVARTGPLLYAVVKPDTLYCLAVLNHGGWSNQQLLDVMDREFPELTQAAALKSSSLKPSRLAVNYSDNDVQFLRNNGINTLTQTSSGRIIANPGGGVNLNKKKGQKSVKVAKANIDVRKLLQQMEDEINAQADAGGVPDGLEAKLTEKLGKLTVTDASGALHVEIKTGIVKPL